MIKKLVEIVKGFLSNEVNGSIRRAPLSTYKDQTGNGLLSTFWNKGNYGEFSSYKYLSNLPGYHRVLFNIYLPKGDDKTTEIDLVYIHENGIFVIESKNYSGWIFGDEKYQKWTQTLPNGQKYQFYNPINQNIGHVEALQTLLPSIPKEIYKSLIVFSERCTLKKINFEAANTFVINRYDLKKLMLKQVENTPIVLEKERIDKIYYFLAQYSKVDSAVKKQHIENIKGAKQ